jgi:chorismate mutase
MTFHRLWEANPKPFIIAGPCSAESRSQMLRCASELQKTGKIDVFRAGIWKPRTRPGQFEGTGTKGLEWLSEIKKTFNLPVITEVATAKHVEKIVEAGIDMIWIGARTTGNPFSVHEIAESLRGVNIPVFVKNPSNPDLELWMGAIERFMRIGITNIAAIHRGFFPFEPTAYRNIPKWEVPIELKTRMPDLPILCDPSHITGNRHSISEIAQYAFDIMMDGLMIEVHPNPDEAKTDAQQQLSPDEFGKIIDKLHIREQTENTQPNQLERMRLQIDSIDQQLIELLGKRFEISRKIAQIKKEQNLAPFQLKRWRNMIDSRIRFAEKAGINPNFVMQLLQSIHKESIAIQNSIMNKKD